MSTSFFPSEVPPRPMGFYAHIILLRETDSYALFQTDGELNTAQVHAGVKQSEIISRITMFKRKQTTPERLVGRELLRRYGLISPELSGKEGKKDDRGVTLDANGLPICDYNVDFCKQCPDCVSYGFAIGDSGSEKSKVYSDTAYSLSAFDESHEAFTLNAPYEGGTMSRQGELTSRINEQDHVRPQTLFPAVITVRDLSEPLFYYVLSNVLRTRRYGAQTTRTGTMTNHLIGVVFSDGELFSNLSFTQHLYDALVERKEIIPAKPISVSAALSAAEELLPRMLAQETAAIHGRYIGEGVRELAIEQRFQGEQGVQTLLASATQASQAYHSRYIKKGGEKKGKK